MQALSAGIMLATLPPEYQSVLRSAFWRTCLMLPKRYRNIRNCENSRTSASAADGHYSLGAPDHVCKSCQSTAGTRGRAGRCLHEVAEAPPDRIIALNNEAVGCPALVDELAGALPAPLLTVLFRSLRPA
jgi:hypothetical protein